MSRLVATGFDADTTASEAAAGLDLAGRRIVVTGAASGIGLEAARVLAAAGAEVTLGVRDVDAGRQSAALAIAVKHRGGSIDVRPLDLLDPASIRAFGQAWTGPLHVLINNAGVMGLPGLTISNGVELQFATNHLGHFALTLQLHGALAAADGARVVALSSVAHRKSPVVLDDISFAHRPYDPVVAYGQSKTANVLFAVHASTLWADDGITVNAVHPGPVVSTGLYRHLDPTTIQHIATTFAQRSIEQGASGMVIAATADELRGVGGRYLEDGNEAPVLDASDLASTGPGVAPHAVDPEAADRLWTESLRLLP